MKTLKTLAWEVVHAHDMVQASDDQDVCATVVIHRVRTLELAVMALGRSLRLTDYEGTDGHVSGLVGRTPCA